MRGTWVRPLVSALLFAAGCASTTPTVTRAADRPSPDRRLAEQVLPVSEEEALLIATRAYLASPQALADAHLVTYARSYPLTETLARPGGCDAWFRGAHLPGQGGDPTGEPPGGEVFDRLAGRLVLVRVQLALLVARCATDQHVAGLPEDLRALAGAWETLAAYATAHGLAMPVSDPAPPRLPPAPVRYHGSGPGFVDVRKPVDRPGDPVLLHGTGRSLRVTTLGADGGRLQVIGDATGTHLVDSLDGQDTVRLWVEAGGPWTVELRSLGLVRRAALPGEVAGTGSDVVLVDLSLLGDRRRAVVRGGQVWVHANRERSLLGPRLPDVDLAVLEVRASGPWVVRTA